MECICVATTTQLDLAAVQDMAIFEPPVPDVQHDLTNPHLVAQLPEQHESDPNNGNQDQRPQTTRGRRNKQGDEEKVLEDVRRRMNKENKHEKQKEKKVERDNYQEIQEPELGSTRDSNEAKQRRLVPAAQHAPSLGTSPFHSAATSSVSRPNSGPGLASVNIFIIIVTFAIAFLLGRKVFTLF